MNACIIIDDVIDSFLFFCNWGVCMRKGLVVIYNSVSLLDTNKCMGLLFLDGLLFVLSFF